MSAFSYNGVRLELVRTNNYSRRAVYTADEKQEECIEHTLDVSAVWNPLVNSYSVSGGGAPIATPGLKPARTDVAVRAALLQPRATLLFENGFDFTTGGLIPVLHVNADGSNGAQADVRGGPFPQSCDIVQVNGCATFMIRFVIKCYTIDCPNANSASAIISNRWTQEEDLDEQHRSTIVTSGRMTFRADRLHDDDGNGLGPDAFRAAGLPLIPKGFKRERIHVTVTEDGLHLAYVTVDRQQMLNLGLDGNGSGAVKVEAFHTVSTQPTGEHGVAGLTTLANVTCRVWGDFNSLRWNLTVLAIKIAMQKIPLDSNQYILLHASITHALHDRFVELQMTAKTNATQKTEGTDASGLPLFTEELKTHYLEALPAAGGTKMKGKPPKAPTSQSPGDPSGLNPPPPGGAGSRGTWIGTLVAQSLADRRCSWAAPAVATPGANDTTTSTPYGGPDAPTVTVGVDNTLPQSDSAAKQPDASGSGEGFSIYNDYRIDVIVEGHECVYYAPVAGDFTPGVPSSYIPPVAVSVASPYSTKTIRWTASRLGLKPKAPSPYTPGTKATPKTEIYLGGHATPAVPAYAADAKTKVWRMSGEYRYLMLTYGGPGTAIKGAILPNSTEVTLSANDISPSDFADGILA
jgi:hypothetical protein